MYFGLILVNEGAAGTRKSLADLEGTTKSVLDEVQLIVPGYYKNPKFMDEVAPSLEKLTEGDPGNKNRKIQEEIREALDRAKSTGDFATLGTALAKAQASVSKDPPQESSYAESVSDAARRLAKFNSDQGYVIPELASRVVDLKALILNAQDHLRQPENAAPEIIKRLALGLVISTFFLRS
jgi:hypothetical protein